MRFGEHDILSNEGAQQGDPIGSLEFCEAIHPLLMSLHSHVKIGFIDADTLSEDLPTVERDIHCSLFTICGDACPLSCVKAEACLTGWPNA